LRFRLKPKFANLKLYTLNFKLPKIYPITDSRLATISHAAQVEKLIEGGATFIQLREKYAAPAKFYEFAEEASAIAGAHNVKIIINDRVDLALALRADGVHLGQDDLPPEAARKILGDATIIGFSTHNLEQAARAVRLPINYLAIGPVFATRTKENPDETIGLEMIKRVRDAIGDFPLVAIGGITSQNFRDVLAAGADSVAIISDLISNPDKISRKLRLLLGEEHNL
jgi:thiamine-phosphate pyrophosphorylase